MLSVYQEGLSREAAYAARQMEHQMKVAQGILDQIIRLAIVLHDLGKMDYHWQKWAHEWQKLIGRPVADDYMVAHTDYNPNDTLHRAVEQKMPGRRPPHAAEGAVAALKKIYYLLGNPRPEDPRWKLVKAVFTAIARHHSPKADSYKSFNLHPASNSVIDQVLANIEINEQVNKQTVPTLEKDLR